MGMGTVAVLARKVEDWSTRITECGGMGCPYASYSGGGNECIDIPFMGEVGEVGSSGSPLHMS